jgi:hypothetical protein
MRGRCSWFVLFVAIAFAMAVSATARATAYRMTIKSVSEAGEKCISTATGSFVQGMRIFIWDCSQNLPQILDYDDQTQALKFGANCVEVVARGGGQDIIAVGKCTNSASQHWIMATTKDNYQIVNANGLCLEISNGVVANGTPLALSKCTPEKSVQLWALFQASEAPAAQSSSNQPSSLGQASPAVAAILERHGLMGAFAEDCKKDPSDTNQYIVHRAIGSGRVGRDQMKDRTVRSYAALVEDAEELSANDIAMNIAITESVNAQMTGWKMHLIMRVDDNRIRLMQSGALTGPYAGRTNIFAGKAAGGGAETRWLTKCR